MKKETQSPTERFWNQSIHRFILSTVFFLYTSLAYAEYDPVADRLENVLLEANSNTAVKTRAQEALVEHYLTQNKLQEAIWVLNSQDKYEEAQKLENQLR
jgi:hypothetical protein